MTRDQNVLHLRSLEKRSRSKLGGLFRRAINRALGFEHFNLIYRQLPSCPANDLSRVLLDAMEVQTTVDGQTLEAIPKQGPLVVVSNHPFGLMEGLVMDSLLQSIREDSTVMATSWLEQIPEFSEHLILVGPVGNKRRRSTSIKGWRQALSWLRNGNALGVFPAGCVARFQWRKLSIGEMDWSPHIAAAIRRTGAKTLPIYFHGRNGLIFQLMAALAPPLVDFRIIREFINKRKCKLRLTIGRIIEPEELEHYKSDKEVIDFLRRQTESLARHSE